MIVLTDIEGTTSSISFVKATLFPYARERLPRFVRDHASRPDVAALLDETRAIAKAPELELDGVVQRLIAWIDEDRKAAPLKELQGILWTAGYAAGELRAHVYPDASSALRRWHAMGIRLYVYSSGSVAAQQQFFAHTEAGDLTTVLSGYFDTRTGAKRETGSYAAIAQHIGAPPSGIVFLSDVVEELDAAAAAGLGTVLVCRDGAPPATHHRTASAFDQLDRLVAS